MVKCFCCNKKEKEQNPKSNSWPLISELALLHTRCAILAKYLTSEPQFPHQKNGRDYNLYLAGVLGDALCERVG